MKSIKKAKAILTIGAVSGFVSVSMGAFAAHALKSKLSLEMFANFKTATQYQMWHTIVLLIIGLLLLFVKSKKLAWSSIFFILGIILFSGSLMTYSITLIKFFAMVTPFGGLSFLVGWILFFLSIKEILLQTHNLRDKL